MHWTESITLDDYATTLQEIKIHLRSARVRWKDKMYTVLEDAEIPNDCARHRRFIL